MSPARMFLCLMLGLALAACASVPRSIERELAPPDGTVPDHFHLHDHPDE